MVLSITGKIDVVIKVVSDRSISLILLNPFAFLNAAIADSAREKESRPKFAFLSLVDFR